MRAIVLILGVGWLFTAPSIADDGVPRVGEPAPNIIASTISQEAFSLSREPEKPKVINFFNRTCDPCVAEMPDLARLEKRYTNVLFYAIHVPWKKDDGDDSAAVTKFLAGLKLHPKTILMGGDKLRELYHYKKLPFTVVLDGENIVQAVIEGQHVSVVEKVVMKLATK
jgi:thiol-disulfide isomerase/thioredoxin